MTAVIVVLTPVLDDWDPFLTLVGHIGEQFVQSDIVLEIVAVDDGSVETLSETALRRLAIPHCIQKIEVIRLALNLGHQRAIAVGLCRVAARSDVEAIVVMDSDGEDRPEDMRNLIEAGRRHPDSVILARRTKRSEGSAFRLGYAMYQALFRTLTGRTISFGNFSLLPIAAAGRLTHMSELWNNLPATIMRSRLPRQQIDTVRGVRYAGESKMNFAGLITHGLSAMAVYTDLIFVRILIGASVICAFALFAMAAVLFIRLATEMAIPGWATIVFGDLFIILFQTLLLVVSTALLVLSNRSARGVVPKIDTPAFIERVTTLYERTDARGR